MEQAAKPAEAPRPKSKKLWVAIAAIVVVVIVGVAAFYLTMPTGTPISIFEKTLGTCPVNDTVACGFSPSPQNIAKGTTIRWTNKGQLDHTATSNSTRNGSLPAFDSSTIRGGNSYSFKFDTAGTYYYYCSIHPWMKASVVVS